jgi:hypothetical protein
MATIHVTNVTSEPVYVSEAYITIPPGGTCSFERCLPDFECMTGLLASIEAGDLTVEIEATTGEVTARNLVDLAEVTRSWSFETVNTGAAYIGGFYEFGATDNDFSPSILFGDVDRAHGSHFFVVTGAVPVDEVTITVTGTSINDDGVRVAADADTIVIPAGTPVNSYFEVKKYNGQVTVETTAGTAITCNYGWAKYHDFNNQDFEVIGLEAIWASEATDDASDLALLHHKAEGWTFNGGAEPDPPTAIARRSTDLDPEDEHIDNTIGAWKRTNLATEVAGSASEGIIVEIVSGQAGVGNQSFRNLNFEVSLRKLPPGNV